MSLVCEAYLERIGFSSETIRDNVKVIVGHANRLCNEEMKEIFVVDYYQEDGSRGYGSLWLMSEQFMCEARDFRKTADYDIDVARIKDAVIYYRVRAEKYDFRNATRESRLMVECANDTGTSFQLKACGENCSRLAEVIDNYIKPNI